MFIAILVCGGGKHDNDKSLTQNISPSGTLSSSNDKKVCWKSRRIYHVNVNIDKSYKKNLNSFETLLMKHWQRKPQNKTFSNQQTYD
jgi:hypothetical protein